MQKIFEEHSEQYTVDNTNLREKLHNFQNEIKQKESLIEEITEQRDSLKNELEKNQKEHNSKIKIKEEEKIKFQKEIEKSTGEHSKKLENLRLEIQTKNETLSKQNLEFQEILKENSKNFEILGNENENLKEEILKLETSNNLFKNKLEKILQENEGIMAEKNNLELLNEKNFEENVYKINNLNEEIIHLKSIEEKLKEELSFSNNLISNLQQNNEKLMSNNASFINDFNAENSKIKEKNQENEQKLHEFKISLEKVNYLNK